MRLFLGPRPDPKSTSRHPATTMSYTATNCQDTGSLLSTTHLCKLPALEGHSTSKCCKRRSREDGCKRRYKELQIAPNTGLADVPGSPSPHKAASVQAVRSPTTVLDSTEAWPKVVFDSFDSSTLNVKRPYCAIHQVGLTNLGKVRPQDRSCRSHEVISDCLFLLFSFHLFRESVTLLLFESVGAKKPDVLRPSRA